MSKLLRANFARLWKNKAFWIAVLFMFGLGIFIVYNLYMDMVKYDSISPMDSAMMSYIPFIGCILAAFCSVFTGTEYSDGTIRNKLIVGHKRSSIYLANLITNAAASVLMIAAFLLSYCTLGSMILEPMVAPVSKVITLVLLSVVTTAAFVSIYTMLATLITRKSTSAIICLLLFFALLMLAMIVQGRLDQPEFNQDYTMTLNGVELTDPVPNPLYLQPAARKLYQFFLDLLPSGQALSISSFSVVHPILMAVYSVVISAVLTVFGIFTFRKKNLK